MILFNSVVFDLISLCVIIFTALYFYLTRNFNFWKNHGVPFVKPIPFFGSIKNVTLQKLSIGHFTRDIYNAYKGETYVGIYSFDEPAVVLRDLDLVKNILVKDSQIFIDRLRELDEKSDRLGARNIFMMNGKKWKHVRTNLTPTFTSGKMKNMFYLVDKCAKELLVYLDESTANGQPMDVKEATARFTTDAIASCAFGIDSNSLKNPNAEFRQKLKKVFDVTSTLKSLAFLLSFFAPKLLKLLHLKIVDSDVEDFVRSTVWNTAKYREEHNISRKDFLDSLMELRKKNEKETEDHSIYRMDDDDYAAQALAFLTAGFETSSSTMSFTMYELSLQPEIQNRLRTETFDVLAKHNNEVTYDAIQEMPYLDMVVNETLRKYPILPILDRKCVTDYDLPSPSGKGTVRIPAGTGVYIPLLGIQYDPEYFPEPEKYDPERFTEENKRNRSNYAHLPFGEGPRICIGMRFGLMQTKAGLIHILSRYEVAPCKDTPIPLVLNKKALFISTGAIPLSFNRIKR